MLDGWNRPHCANQPSNLGEEGDDFGVLLAHLPVGGTELLDETHRGQLLRQQHFRAATSGIKGAASVSA